VVTQGYFAGNRCILQICISFMYFPWIQGSFADTKDFFVVA